MEAYMDILLKERLVSYYEKHILEDVMPFWDRRCIDKEYGGYITCFDREGKMTDDKKYIWFQGRQLYIYSLLYNKVRKKKEWLENAKHGFSFLVNMGMRAMEDGIMYWTEKGMFWKVQSQYFLIIMFCRGW